MVKKQAGKKCLNGHLENNQQYITLPAPVVVPV